MQPDCLDDLAYAIMYELTKLCYRVSEADVIRARNQVICSSQMSSEVTFWSYFAQGITHHMVFCS